MNFPNKVTFKPRWSYPVVGGEGAGEKKNTKNRNSMWQGPKAGGTSHFNGANIGVLSSRCEREEREREITEARYLSGL